VGFRKEQRPHEVEHFVELVKHSASGHHHKTRGVYGVVVPAFLFRFRRFFAAILGGAGGKTDVALPALFRMGGCGE